MYSWFILKHPGERDIILRIQDYLPTGRLWDTAISLANAWRRLGYFPNIANPRTLNEIVLHGKWRFGGNIELARLLTDKQTVKAWLADNGLESLITPTLAVFDSSQDAARFSSELNFIAKSTHGSGDTIIKAGKGAKRFTSDEIERMDGWLHEDYYVRGREINYKGLKHKVIIEEMLVSPDHRDLRDYKILCFLGEPFLIQVDIDRHTDHTRQLYTVDWELLPFSMSYPRNDMEAAQPTEIGDALTYARSIARNFRFVRVDFYISTMGLRLGEVTFFPANGAETFASRHDDLTVGMMARAATGRNDINQS